MWNVNAYAWVNESNETHIYHILCDDVVYVHVVCNTRIHKHIVYTYIIYSLHLMKVVGTTNNEIKNTGKYDRITWMPIKIICKYRTDINIHWLKYILWCYTYTSTKYMYVYRRCISSSTLMHHTTQLLHIHCAYGLVCESVLCSPVVCVCLLLISSSMFH